MINIDVKRKFIPIQIGSNEFEFDLSDDAILKLRETYNKVVSGVEKVKLDDSLTEKQRIETTKKMQKQAIDFLLGRGAFEKIYAEVGSIASITDVLVELNIQLPKEIENAMASEKTKKYVGT